MKSYVLTTKTARYWHSDPNFKCLHRTDGPAVEQLVSTPLVLAGTNSWFFDGLLHRDNAPAIEYPDGAKSWYQFGKLHRIGGPAHEGATIHEQWYQCGAKHRLDGPAVIKLDGTKEWWLYGVQLTEAEHTDRVLKDSYGTND